MPARTAHHGAVARGECAREAIGRPRHQLRIIAAAIKSHLGKGFAIKVLMI